MITIVDYGVGNLASISNMLAKIGVPSSIARTADDIAQAAKLILPGVGAFDHAMRNLRERGLRSALEHKVRTEKIPVLGLCLGAQLLTRRSEEGQEPGLGWIDADTVSFDRSRLGDEHRVPHMGWSDVSSTGSSRLLSNLPVPPRFYFAHSFHIRCADERTMAGTAEYGYRFAAVVEDGNIVGAQFHPEKSHRFGMQLLRNYAELY
jgi:imidazole glycerol-phosphate synthase subunit HisH